jgi:hypothetical protein
VTSGQIERESQIKRQRRNRSITTVSKRSTREIHKKDETTSF